MPSSERGGGVPKARTVRYSDFLHLVERGEVKECEVGIDDVTFTLKDKEATKNKEQAAVPIEVPRRLCAKQVTAPQPLLDKLMQHKVAFRQADGASLREAAEAAAGGDLLGPILNLALYSATGYGLYWMHKHMDEESNVGLKADETSFDKSISFDDIAGIDESKALVVEVVNIIKNPSAYTKVGARIPKGILLCGPPGTGKTLLARCIASEAELLSSLFERARKVAPSVVFIDELDALGKARGRGFSGNDEGEQTLNQLLACMDGIDGKGGKPVVCIAATNRMDILDEALVRPGRFDRVIKVGVPDENGRKAVMKVHTKNLPLDSDVNFDVLAKDAMSPAEIAAIANEAAIGAARRGGDKVRQSDFDQALIRHVVSRQTEEPGTEPDQRHQQQQMWEEMFMRFLMHQQQQYGDGGKPAKGHVYREASSELQEVVDETGS
eukprot:CAMPEP_0114114438 /NCGR_PEP_ID=MMETSP0043_2-20121206/3434_1 /TAXON_ID=464988 /ORGANISM="Hemiselmis andersenii, Strain CCMP644" /LENGTH=438 /DNA_ID=CAMNT_0001206631 /DNA_START=1 /DNA_END=1322 /DNA_ORIENTATION=-